MIRFAHITNPVIVDNTSDLYKAQPVTFESMRRARVQAHQSGVHVDLIAAYFPEDESIVPDYFVKARPLESSIKNIQGVDENKKLPFIADILERVFESSNADYVIYTNADIALMPFFYQTVAAIIDQGYESFIINRRSIKNDYSVSQMELMYAEVGDMHPGSDCFVFKREMLQKFRLGKIVIGRIFVGLALRTNVITYSKKFEHFRNLHLTFHLGDDRVWKNILSSAKHNARELESIFPLLLEDSMKYSYKKEVEILFENFNNRRNSLNI
jgi:hypothetical protein